MPCGIVKTGRSFVNDKLFQREQANKVVKIAFNANEYISNQLNFFNAQIKKSNQMWKRNYQFSISIARPEPFTDLTLLQIFFKERQHFGEHSSFKTINHISMVTNIFFGKMFYAQRFQLFTKLHVCYRNMTEVFIAPPINF